MINKKDAFKILGINENSSKYQIERRYDVLLKRHKSEKLSKSGLGSKGINIEEITGAYNVLMGYVSEEPEKKEDKKPNPLLKKMGVDEKKAANFFHYHKYHIIISIIVIVVLISSVKSCVNRVDPDFNMAFVGSFFYSDTSVLRENILDKWTSIEEIGIDGAMLSEKGDNELDYAMQMKAAVLFGGGDIDVFVLDRTNFERYAKQGAFISLDNIAEELGVDKEKNKDNIVKIEPDEEEEEEEEESHLYGINVEDNPIFELSEIKGNEKIAAIYVRTKRKDLCIEFLELLLDRN